MKNLMIISFTEEGSRRNRELNLQLKKQGYTCESYAVSRFAEKSGLQPLPSDTKEWIGSLWGRVDFVFIGAVGIAVRYIAAWVEDKYKDSAVLSMDERGRFVIPVLSGHVGGGVELAEVIASCMGAVPVITTATDVQERFAVDVFARKNRLHIGSRELAKRISAAVLEGKKIGFYSAYPVRGELPEEVMWCETVSGLDQYEYGVAVAAQEEGKLCDVCNAGSGADGSGAESRILYLPLKDLVVGIGCRKGIPYLQILAAVQSVFRENGWNMERICALASIDLKQEEPGILELAKTFGIPFDTYSAKQLQEVEQVSYGSAFVASVTGVDNVCERAAKRYCKDGILLLPKVKLEQVTLAVVQRKAEIRF